MSLYLNYALAVIFGIAMVLFTYAIITIISSRLIRWIAIAITIFLVIAFWIVFSNWLFALWAVLLSLLTWLFLIIHGWLWRVVVGLAILAVFIVGVIFTGPSINIFTPVAQVGNTANSDAPIDLNCTAASVITSQTHGGKVEVDLNDGDPFDYSLTVVNPDLPTPTGKTLIVLAEPGHIFNVVHPVMYFTSYRLRGTLDQALCSVSKMNIGHFTYVFVGKASTPKGWTSTDIKGWWTELVAKQYSDEKTITPGGDWTTFQIAGDDKNRDLKSENFIYGQFWNPNYGGTVVHVQVEKGYTLKVVNDWQGTYWTVTGADPILVQDRFIQASKEVLERDKLSLSNITLLYCGDPANMPTTKLVVGGNSLNWTSELKYWDCQKTK